MNNFRNRVNKKRQDIATKSDDSFGKTNYAEYMVDKKPLGKYKAQRTLMIILYILVPLAIAGVLVAIQLYPVIAIVPVIAWMLVFFTWKYVSQSCYYEVDSAQVAFLTVFGGRKERELLSAKVKDFVFIAPNEDKYKEEAEKYISGGAEKIDCMPYPEAEDGYVGICEKDGKKYVVYFVATGQSLKAFKYYNSSAVVMKATRR